MIWGWQVPISIYNGSGVSLYRLSKAQAALLIMDTSSGVSLYRLGKAQAASLIVDTSSWCVTF